MKYGAIVYVFDVQQLCFLYVIVSFLDSSIASTTFFNIFQSAAILPIRIRLFILRHIFRRCCSRRQLSIHFSIFLFSMSWGLEIYQIPSPVELSTSMMIPKLVVISLKQAYHVLLSNSSPSWRFKCEIFQASPISLTVAFFTLSRCSTTHTYRWILNDVLIAVVFLKLNKKGMSFMPCKPNQVFYDLVSNKQKQSAHAVYY